MMTLDIELCGGPACETDLLKFEDFIHAHLPSSYRAFLLLHNGCIPASTTDTFTTKTNIIVGNQITVEQFYSMRDDKHPLLSLYQVVQDLVGVVPVTTVPIAHDSFGNVVGLDWETDQVNWTLCQAGYPFDLHRNFDLGVNFVEFVDSLGSGLYNEKAQSNGAQKKRTFWHKLWGSLKRLRD
ncbi:MAG: SMI1/KNR4 family protein [Verrucomicrobiaceae bacterium]